MDAPVLPGQNPTVHLVAHTLGLDHMQRFQGVSDLEVGFVDGNLLGQVVVGGKGRGESLSGSSLGVCSGR